RYLKELRPTDIHDINAMVALCRTGPMESIPEYIRRKHNPRLIEYLDPRMEDILKESYGVITYQDDVLLIAIKLAGYSWLQADTLRKAMGKKIPAVMKAEREQLVAGFVKNGLSEEKAEKLWSLILPFAAYGFNKAHAASYGKVAYQTAYMKANFPAIYMASVLTAESGDVEQIGEIVAECTRMGITVLPPSVNESFTGFTVIKADASPSSPIDYRLKTVDYSGIRFGLTTIKNFGEGVAHSIIEERKRAGRFASLSDFLRRIKDRNLNKKSLEALVKSGALDEFGERGQMLANIDRILLYGKETAGAPQGASLFAAAGMESVTDITLTDAASASTSEKLAWEKELLGLYLSGHPLDKFRKLLAGREMNIKRVREELKEGMMAVVGGIVTEARPITTKGGEPMIFAKLADFTGGIEVVVFPRVFNEHKALFVPEQCIAIKGRISHRNGEVSLIAEQVKALA
ncbi:MAG: DNA polymerase III subunit alpha, partial [Parcubacteria group bacterium Gr01-1014_72]